jgi:membrane protein DedA with SNARE-associated domain
MPFAGFLVTSGKFSFWSVVLASTIGSLIGSLLSYYIGMYGGRVFLEKWGKY